MTKERLSLAFTRQSLLVTVVAQAIGIIRGESACALFQVGTCYCLFHPYMVLIFEYLPTHAVQKSKAYIK